MKPQEEPTPEPPAARRRWLLPGALAAVVIAVSLGVVALVYAHAPQAVAERYLGHIASGDATSAAALLAPSHPGVAGFRDDALLTDEVLQSAVERISDVSVARHPASDVDVANFDITFTLAGEKYDERLDLIAGAPLWGVIPTWQVRAPFSVAFLLEASGPAPVTIAGVPISAPARGDVAWVTMYPAVYRLGVDGDYYTTTSDTITVGIDNSPGTVDLRPTERLERAVQEEVEAVLADCMAQATMAPEGCPFQASADATGVPVSWGMDAPPTVVLDETGTRFSFDDGWIRAVYMPATASGETQEEAALWLSGTVSVHGSDVEVRFLD